MEKKINESKKKIKRKKMKRKKRVAGGKNTKGKMN